MKHLIVALIVSLPMIFSSAAMAWSPLEDVETSIERVKNCFFIDVSSDEGETAAQPEEEEEPDCE